MNKIYQFIFFFQIVSFALSLDSDYNDLAVPSKVNRWSWLYCKEPLKNYSLYLQTVQESTKFQDEDYFACARYFSSESRENCQKNKASLISDITKNFYQECVIPYYIASSQLEKKKYTICGKNLDACLTCINRRGQTAGCKSISSNNSPKQNEYQTFSDNLKANCDIANKCPSNLGSYAQSACESVERNECILDWQMKNVPEDACLKMFVCYQQQFSKSNEKFPDTC